MTKDNKEPILNAEDLVVKEEEKVSPAPLPKEEEPQTPKGEQSEASAEPGINPRSGFKGDKIEWINIDSIRPNEWNPNKEDEETFNLLVESINNDGFIDPIQIIATPDDITPYRIIGGEHRYTACKTLGWLSIPAIILKDFDLDKQKLLTVRMNVLKGKLNPIKLSNMITELATKYGAEGKSKMIAELGITQKAAERLKIDAIFDGALQGLPEEIKEKVKKAREEVKTIDDLSVVLNKMFKEFGSTVPHHYMFFTYGGKKHIMIQCDKKTFELSSEVIKVANQQGISADKILFKLLNDWQQQTQHKEDPLG